MQGRLAVTENGHIREHELEDSTTVGRAQDNDIQILDVRASKLHCRIMRVESGFTLIDEGSTNGTRLNGQPTRRALLNPGDVIEIGEVKLVFTGDAPLAEPSSAETVIGGVALQPPTPPHPTGARPRRAVAAPAPPVPVKTILSLNDRLRRILAGNVQLLGERNLKRLLETILDSAVEIAGAERGFVILQDATGGPTTVAAARNIDRESLRRPAEKFSRSIAEQVLSTGAGVLSANASEDPRFAESMSVSELSLRSILCVPIRAPGGERSLGVIYVDNRFSQAVFTDDELALLDALSWQAAVALENARLFEAERHAAAQLEVSRAQLEVLNQELRAQVDEQNRKLVELNSGLTPAPREHKYKYSEIIGSSPAMEKVFETLDRVIDSSVPVLIQGESGTGKELIARAIHHNSARKKKPFITENCAAITETLLESELFGHVRGAFTDAHADKPGLFEVADGGTLFLDEIGDMSQGMQKKLLRVLQEGEVRRVGGNKPLHVDVRVIAASNKRLREMIKVGLFREDLYYRLNVITLELPPLRERREDIEPLVRHFLEVISRDTGSSPRRITQEALTLLKRHDWPGNIRELDNELRRACALSDDVIDVDILSEEIRNRVRAPVAPATAMMPEGVGLKEFVKSHTIEVERRVIAQTLLEMEWRKNEVAERLKISRPTLDSKIDSLGIEPPDPERR